MRRWLPYIFVVFLLTIWGADALVLNKKLSSRPPGTFPDWHCSVNGTLTQEVACLTLTNTNVFAWVASCELNYTNTYAFANTSAGADSAWTNLYDDIDTLGGWSLTYTNISTNVTLECSFNETQEVIHASLRPGYPMWSGGLEWNGTGWDANYRYYRYAPTIDLSSYGFDSADYRAYLYFLWQPNDYLGTGGDWPYPVYWVGATCFDISSSLDGEVNFADENLFIPMKQSHFMAQKYDKPLSVTSTNYAGGWVPAAMKILIYDLP